MELAYAYITGDQFRQRVEKLFEVITNLDDDLNKEKRAITLSWARRETQLNQLAECMTGVYGDMQGIVGAKVMPTIEAFEVTTLLEKHRESPAGRPAVTSASSAQQITFGLTWKQAAKRGLPPSRCLSEACF